MYNFIDFKYRICNCYIQKVNHAKYLEVVIDKHLSWSEHISQIIKKANSAKAFLQHNFNCCPIPVKAKLYTTLVRPILEFCCTVWSPYTISDIFGENPTECSQICLWAWIIPGTTVLLPCWIIKIQWPTLKDRRHHLIAAMMYKINLAVNNLIDIEASLYLTPTTSATCGHSYTVLVWFSFVLLSRVYWMQAL